MKYKLLIILAGIAAFTFAFGGFMFVKNKSFLAEPTPTPVPSPTPFDLATYEDQSLFSFQYPKNLELNPHPEDQENYAHVELTSIEHPGNLIAWTKDTASKDLEALKKSEKIENAIDTTLGENPAIKVLQGTDSKKITISTIKEGFLYQLETDLTDEEYWLKVFDQVLSSYKFTGDFAAAAQVNTDSTVQTGSSEEIFEGEELIE